MKTSLNKKLVLCFLAVTLFWSFAYPLQIETEKDNPLQMENILKQGAEYEYVKPMVGKWTV